MKAKLYLLFSALAFTSCYDVEEYLKKKSESKLPTVTLSPSIGALANGKDLLEVKVSFETLPDKKSSTVTFSTTEGVFIENDKSEYTSSQIRKDTLTNEFYAIARIRATVNKGNHIVTVTVPNVPKIQVGFQLRPSYPTALTTDKNKFGVARGFRDEIQLIANAKADSALPSKGTRIEFSVEGFTPENSNMFRSRTTTDEKGQASIYFTPGNALQLGRATYKVGYIAAKDTIYENGTFEVIEPE